MTIDLAKLQAFTTRCFVKTGVPEYEANLISRTLVEADARGIHSHGLMRLPIYIERMQKGYILSQARTTVETETNTTALLDGNFSAGQVVGTRAMELAIEKAESQGLGAVAVKNSNHFGTAAQYALMASHRNMIGIAMSNTAPILPAVGGADKTIGNNPLAIAVPSNNQYPFILDMAMSNVAMGKVFSARAKGTTIPDSWGVDKNGSPTTEPSEVIEGGSLMPMAGPKGFGLALVVEALTGVLSSGQFANQIPYMYDLTQRQGISHFMLVINVARFMEIELFKERMSALSMQVKEAEKADNVEEIFLPGEIELSLEAGRGREHMPIDESTLRELEALARKLQIAFPE